MDYFSIPINVTYIAPVWWAAIPSDTFNAPPFKEASGDTPEEAVRGLGLQSLVDFKSTARRLLTDVGGMTLKYGGVWELRDVNTAEEEEEEEEEEL